MDVGAVLASQMEPRGGRRACGNRRVGGPRRSWDRLGLVLFSSCDSGSLFLASWVPLGVVLRCSWDHFWPSWELLGSFWGTPDGILKSYNPIGYISLNSSVLQPIARQLFASRAGGLREAIK